MGKMKDLDIRAREGSLSPKQRQLWKQLRGNRSMIYRPHHRKITKREYRYLQLGANVQHVKRHPYSYGVLLGGVATLAGIKDRINRSPKLQQTRVGKGINWLMRGRVLAPLAAVGLAAAVAGHLRWRRKHPMDHFRKRFPKPPVRGLPPAMGAVTVSAPMIRSLRGM